MELKYLESFAAVVRHMSFSRAAEELYLSQPTISLHVSRLEEELSARLLVRTTKSIEVTAKGRRVYEYALSILSLKDRMMEECSGSSHIINLGASTIPSAYILPEVLPEYVRRNPDTYFVITQGDSREVEEKLMDGVISLGLMGMKPSREELTAIPFYEDSVVLITPVNEHFLALKKEKKIPLKTLLKEEPVILREKGSGSRKAGDRVLEEAGISPDELHVTARINDPEAIKNLVAGGLGISFISGKAAADYRDGNRLLTFELPRKGSRRQLYAVYRTSFIMPPCCRDFLKFLQNFYAEPSKVPQNEALL